ARSDARGFKPRGAAAGRQELEVDGEKPGARNRLAGALPNAALDLHGVSFMRHPAAVAWDDSSARNSAKYRRVTDSRKLSSKMSFLQATSSMRPVFKYLPPRQPPTHTGRYAQSPHWSQGRSSISGAIFSAAFEVTCATASSGRPATAGHL